MQQGTQEWLQARCGRFTASRMADLTAKTKSGPSASRKNYLAELLIERMTDTPTDTFTSAAMQWGTDNEPEARRLYELAHFVTVDEVGFIRHPVYDYAGASPDGLIGSDGAIEIKCPNTATHIDTLRSRKVPDKYYKQIQWVLDCTQRDWCDFVSYDPRMKHQRLVMFVTRVARDDNMIEALRNEVEAAETELRQLVDEVTAIAEGSNDT